jgi:hypothetical protein
MSAIRNSGSGGGDALEAAPLGLDGCQGAGSRDPAVLDVRVRMVRRRHVHWDGAASVFQLDRQYRRPLQLGLRRGGPWRRWVVEPVVQRLGHWLRERVGLLLLLLLLLRLLRNDG